MIELNSRVKLRPGIFGDSLNNPAWGGRHGYVLGTIVILSDSGAIDVIWDNGKRNTYHAEELEEAKPEDEGYSLFKIQEKKTMKVAQVGWQDENPLVAIVLLDKTTRRALGVAPGMIVSVAKTGSTKSAIAIVDRQFKDQVGKGVSINKVLGTCLELEVGNEITLRSAKPLMGRIKPEDLNGPPMETE